MSKKHPPESSAHAAAPELPAPPETRAALDPASGELTVVNDYGERGQSIITVRPHNLAEHMPMFQEHLSPGDRSAAADIAHEHRRRRQEQK